MYFETFIFSVIKLNQLRFKTSNFFSSDIKLMVNSDNVQNNQLTILFVNIFFLTMRGLRKKLYEEKLKKSSFIKNEHIKIIRNNNLILSDFSCSTNKLEEILNFADANLHIKFLRTGKYLLSGKKQDVCATVVDLAKICFTPQGPQWCQIYANIFLFIVLISTQN